MRSIGYRSERSPCSISPKDQQPQQLGAPGDYVCTQLLTVENDTTLKRFTYRR